MRLPTLAISLTGLIYLAGLKLYQGAKQPVITKKEFSHTTKPPKPAALVDVEPTGISNKIPDIGLLLSAGLPVNALKTPKDFKSKLKCEFVGSSKADGREDFSVCSYTTAQEHPKLTLIFVYNRTNKKIYQYNIDSTIPKYVDTLKKQLQSWKPIILNY